jgi:phage head maturation protease
MPKPNKGESQKDFVSRCIPIVLDEGTAKDNKQASAICYNIYRENKKEKNCSVRELEFKEENNELYVKGLIATSHVDAVGDRIPKPTLELWAKQINMENPQTNKVSYHHNMEEKVVGRGVPSAEVIQLPDNNWGLVVETHVNKSWSGYDDLMYELKNKFIDGFSIEYDTHNDSTTHQEVYDGKPVRVLGPDTELFGWSFASRPVQANAVITEFGFKELFKQKNMEEINMPSETLETKEEKMPVETTEKKEIVAAVKEEINDQEMKEFKEWKNKKENMAFEEKVADIVKNMEIKEKVLQPKETKSLDEIPFEVKEFAEIFDGKKEISIKEQFRRASRVADKYGLWAKGTKSVVMRKADGEFKNFTTRGRFLEYKGLGITTNQNADTDYLQSAAELQDVYDPIIYNALNQATTTWNVLQKDDFSQKGNNLVQFALKTGTNESSAFYTGNAVSTGNVTRIKYQTKFKKLQVGINVDGDMIAAARGGPISDVFAQEVEDSTMDMLATLNAALYAEVGAETASAIIGFEYITDSAGNTTLYNVTRSSTNKLAPTTATDTYINMNSAIISMTNLRKAITQAIKEGCSRSTLVFFTSPTQGDMYRNKWDDSIRHVPRDTIWGFQSDLFVDGIPVFEDKDCNTDDWFLVDLESHRVAIWVPPTIERLGKTDDSESAFIKMYLATYNRKPRAMVQIYGCATS